jgi:hypothetical protein
VYTHIPLDPTPSLHGAYTNNEGEHVAATERWLEKYPPAIAAQHLDLNEMIAHRASDEYYGRFFDPSKSSASSNGTAPQSSAPDVPETPADAVDEDKLAAMRARVRGHAGQASLSDVD